MVPENDTTTVILLAILIAFFAVVIITSLVSKISTFRREMKYINKEIGRTEGAERRYWEQQKKRLWSSLLPFSRR